MPSKDHSPISRVSAFMEDYARRGVFRGFSRQPAANGVAFFRLIWHRGRTFELVVDTAKKTIRVPIVLPCVPDDMYRDFKSFVESHHAISLPDHRRIEKSKALVKCANRGQGVSLSVAVKDGDYEYALQRVLHMIHETYLIFLANGIYRDYMIEQLGADIDIG